MGAAIKQEFWGQVSLRCLSRGQEAQGRPALESVNEQPASMGLRGRDCIFCGWQCSGFPLGSLLITESPCFCLVLSPSHGDPATGQCAVKCFTSSSRSPAGAKPAAAGRGVFCFLCLGMCSTLHNTCSCRGISGRTRCKVNKVPNP